MRLVLLTTFFLTLGGETQHTIRPTFSAIPSSVTIKRRGCDSHHDKVSRCEKDWASHRGGRPNPTGYC